MDAALAVLDVASLIDFVAMIVLVVAWTVP